MKKSLVFVALALALFVSGCQTTRSGFEIEQSDGGVDHYINTTSTTLAAPRAAFSFSLKML